MPGARHVPRASCWNKCYDLWWMPAEPAYNFAQKQHKSIIFHKFSDSPGAIEVPEARHVPRASFWSKCYDLWWMPASKFARKQHKS